MIKAATTNQSSLWFAYLRPKVGDSITHKNYEWVNVTGSNSEPGNGSDWVFVKRLYPSIFVDFNSEDDKTNRWVFGEDVPTINDGDPFIGKSTVANPLTDDDFSKFLIAN